MNWGKIDIVLVGILVLAGFLLLYNLYGIPLWRDEAATAGLAQSILKSGLPSVHDGKNFILANPHEYNDALLPVREPWLPLYATAFSFGLFGKSVFSARLPFALAGLFSVLLTYLLAKELFQSKDIARMSCFLTAINVVFLLHMRQSRYYGFLLLFSLWMLYSYSRFLNDKKFAREQFAVSSFLLFHSQWFYFVVLLAVICVHFLYYNYKSLDSTKGLVPLLVFIGFVVLSWFLYAMPWKSASDGGSFIQFLLSPEYRFNEIFKYYWLTITMFVIPVPLFIIGFLLHQYKEKISANHLLFGLLGVLFLNAYFLYFFKGILDLLGLLVTIALFALMLYKHRASQNITLLLGLVLATVFGLTLVHSKDIRYALVIIPVIAILSCYLVISLTSRKLICYGLLILLATNFLSVLSILPLTPFKTIIWADFANSYFGSYNSSQHTDVAFDKFVDSKFKLGIPALWFYNDLQKNLVSAEVQTCNFLKKYGVEGDIVVTFFDVWDAPLKFYCPEFQVNPPKHTAQPDPFVYFPKDVSVDWFVAEKVFPINRTVSASGSYFEIVTKMPIDAVTETIRPEPWMHNFGEVRKSDINIYKMIRKSKKK